MEMMGTRIRRDRRIGRGGSRFQRLFDPLSPSIPRLAFRKYGIEGRGIGSYPHHLYISRWPSHRNKEKRNVPIRALKNASANLGLCINNLARLAFYLGSRVAVSRLPASSFDSGVLDSVWTSGAGLELHMIYEILVGERDERMLCGVR